MKERTGPFPFLVRRLILVYGLVLIWCVALLVRFFYLQVVCVEELRAKAALQYSGFSDLAEIRGEIFDRRLIPLATNVEAYTVGVDPQILTDSAEAARQLAPFLGLSPEELLEKITKPGVRYVTLKQRCEPEEAERLRKLDVKGLVLQRINARYYPKASLAAQVLGFVGVDGKGLGGVEYLFDKEIRGERKRVYFVFDGQRRSYQRAQPDHSTEGNMLVLSLDQTIQFEAEQSLKSQVEASGARFGTVIVMNPRSGEILAMASYPAFDPNDPASDPELHRNRATLETYEPGSIFKVISFSAALNEGLADLEEVIDCRVGTLRIAGKVYREAKRSYGDLRLTDVLAKSSNVGTIKLTQRLGEERLHEYIRRFGFGSKTGIDFPGEESGRVRPVAEWSDLSIAALAIGQELAVTPLQMLRGVAAIANGGSLVRPILVRQILSPEGDPLWVADQRSERILDASTVEAMKKAMETVVEGGTGTRARLNGFSSGGKTGTAQKFIDGAYSDTRYVASYVGFAPLDDPALVALVVIDEPRGEYYGGVVATPVFKEVMEKALIHLQIPRDRPLDRDVPRREMVFREQPADFGVLDAENGGDLPPGLLDEALTARMQPAERVVILPAHLVEVPDFTGLSLRQVASECAQIGLQLKSAGLGVATAQRPRAGRSVLKGSVCEVHFSNKGNVQIAPDRVAFKNSLPETPETWR